MLDEIPWMPNSQSFRQVAAMLLFFSLQILEVKEDCKSLVPIFFGTLSYVICCIDIDIKNKDTPSARYYSILRYYSLFL